MAIIEGAFIFFGFTFLLWAKFAIEGEEEEGKFRGYVLAEWPAWKLLVLPSHCSNL